MSALVDFAFSLAGLFVALISGVLWLSVRPASRHSRRFLLGVVIAYLLASIYVVPYTIGRILVIGFHEFSASDVPPGPTAIVVLGGGGVTVRDWQHERLSVPGAAAAARILEAFRVYRLLPDAWIISSGGPGPSRDVRQSDAVIMRDVLLRLGVPDSRIILE